MYDAAGNKLQKYVKMYDCDPATGPPCHGITETRFDYIGNFVYENGQLKMIYHPEGVIRPTPENAENDTEFVFDYFIKDYLGNVRVAITEEDAVEIDKFLATMEDVYATYEEENFENLDETREDLPTAYPIDASVEFNERIALLSAANGTEIGPSTILPVRRGDRVSLSTQYFFTQDAPGESYGNLGFLINEVLLAFASSGAGVLPLSEAQLLGIAQGSGTYPADLLSMFNTNMDTTDMSSPHAYLVWTAYDHEMNILPQSSGAERVRTPNQLELILREGLNVSHDGYMHVYVSNGSAKGISFDNILITYLRGKVRQINHYYPYGLSIASLDEDSDEYLNKYTSKELQTGEFDPTTSTGLEMFDFHARFYDPQLGRWFTPDPAEQFSNPYLAMGNNPVVYVDPDGEFVFLIPHISFSGGSFDIGITFGLGFPGGSAVTATIGHSFQDGPDNTYVSFGANLGPVCASVGWGTQTGFTAGVGTGYGFGGPITQKFTSIGVSWSQNYGISVNVSAWSRSNGGWHFNPSVGVAPTYGWIPDKPDGLPGYDLTASTDGPAAIVNYSYGPEIVEKLTPSQRFKQWQRNRSQWSNWSTYGGPWAYNPLEGYSLNVNFEFSVGAQKGLGMGALGVGPVFSARPVYYEIYEGNFSPGASEKYTHNYIGKNGVRVGNEFGSPIGRVFSEFNSSGTQNHIYGGNYGPYGISNKGSYVPIFRAQAHFVIGLRLSIHLQKLD